MPAARHEAVRGPSIKHTTKTGPAGLRPASAAPARGLTLAPALRVDTLPAWMVAAGGGLQGVEGLGTPTGGLGPQPQALGDLSLTRARRPVSGQHAAVETLPDTPSGAELPMHGSWLPSTLSYNSAAWWLLWLGPLRRTLYAPRSAPLPTTTGTGRSTPPRATAATSSR